MFRPFTSTYFPNNMNDFSLKTQIGRLRLVGYAEGISFLLLLCIAMPLKYLAGKPEMVRVVGMAHGLLFVLYILQVIQAKIEYDWSLKTMVLGIVASVLPFGPFIADAKLFRMEAQ
jgi:integral membrane protein